MRHAAGWRRILSCLWLCPLACRCSRFINDCIIIHEWDLTLHFWFLYTSSDWNRSRPCYILSSSWMILIRSSIPVFQLDLALSMFYRMNCLQSGMFQGTRCTSLSIFLEVTTQYWFYIDVRSKNNITELENVGDLHIISIMQCIDLASTISTSAHQNTWGGLGAWQFECNNRRTGIETKAGFKTR